MKRYKIVESYPVARFYYKGKHSHPIRRTVLIVEQSRHRITGYEVREGSVVRDVSSAPIKSYSRTAIARYNKLGANKHRQPGPELTSLKRSPLHDFLFTGP
jgi:hypothetical protein